MTPQYILRKSLCREPWCASGPNWRSTAKTIIDNLQYAREYAEPGYDNPHKGILLANWNYFPAKATDLLESYGYSIEWEDEWTTCDGCYKAVRTSPDSWQWTPSYDMTDCEVFCNSCKE